MLSVVTSFSSSSPDKAKNTPINPAAGYHLVTGAPQQFYEVADISAHGAVLVRFHQKLLVQVT